MSALHRSAADVQGRTDDLIHAKGVCSDGGADDVDHCVNRAYFVKVHLFDGSGVNLRFRCSQSFKDGDGSLLGSVANFRFADDFANLGQASAVRVRVLMGRRGRPRSRTVDAMRMLVGMVVAKTMSVNITVLMVSFRGRGWPHHILLFPVLFPRHVLLAIHPHVDLGCRNSVANDSRNLQPCAHAQRRDGFFQHPRRYSGVDERAQEHVAAHAGKALKIRNAHRIEFLTTEDTESTEEKT